MCVVVALTKIISIFIIVRCAISFIYIGIGVQKLFFNFFSCSKYLVDVCCRCGWCHFRHDFPQIRIWFFYLSTAVLTLVAMTASSPQADNTVHFLNGGVNFSGNDTLLSASG